MEKKIKIGVIDDQKLFRQGMISLLKRFDKLDVVLEASSAEELFTQLEVSMPDVILLDIEMPEMNGIEATKKLKEKWPELKIIIVSMHNEQEMIIYMIQNGAHSFLPKNENIDEVVKAITTVYETGYCFNNYVSSAMIKDLMLSKTIDPKFEAASLCEKEISIIKLICEELTNKEIADKLSLSVRTIHGCREKIMKKTQTKNMAGIVMYAIKNKIIA